MDREKVIKGIQECNLNGGLIGNCPYKGILFMLKEQEEVKPIAKEDDTFECVCGAIVGWEELDSSGIVTNRFNYCPFCGKAVKWE